MSKSRDNLPKWCKSNFNHTHHLHPWLNDCFNDPFNIISTAPSMDLTAINMQAMFNELLIYNKHDVLTLLRQRSTTQQNMLHFLLGWKLDRAQLRKTNKTHSQINDTSFSESQPHHIFYQDELKENAKLIYPNRKKMVLTTNEYETITSNLIQEKVSFYFESLEKYYEAQLLNLTKALLSTLSERPEIIVSMLVERDNNGLTPLYCLTMQSPKNESTPNLFNLIMEYIKTFPEEDKNKILFAPNTLHQLFLHTLCQNFSLDINKLCDTFEINMLVAAFTSPDKNRATPLHIACTRQKKSLASLFQLINTCKRQSILYSQDSTSHTPLAHLVKNKHFTDNDISVMLSKLNLDTFIIDQNITSQTPTGDSLLTLALKHNRYSIIKAIQQHASQQALLPALLRQNKAGQHALQIAYFEGSLDTYKLAVKLYSQEKPAFLGILAIAPIINGSKHFSRFDAQEFHKEFLGVINADIFKLAVIIDTLINTTYPSNAAGFINEFVEACVCITQNLPLHKSQDARFTLFAPARFPNLDKKITGVTPEHVYLYFNAALPMVKTYASEEQRTYIEMILNRFNTKMLESTSVFAPSTLLTLNAPVELQPIYEHDLELRWKTCLTKERELAERKNMIEVKIAELRAWESRLNQQGSFQPEKTVTPPFILTNAFAKSKLVQKQSVEPQIIDALEYRRKECDNRETFLSQKENVVTQREKELSQWESNLLKREQEIYRNANVTTQKTYSY